MTRDDWDKVIKLVEFKAVEAAQNWPPAVEEWTTLATKLKAARDSK